MQTKTHDSHDMIRDITGLSTPSVFGLLVSASSMVFGPITALQLPAPASYFMWGFIGMTVIAGLSLAVWETGVKAMGVSLRRHPVTWAAILAGTACAVFVVLDFMGFFGHTPGIL